MIFAMRCGIVSGRRADLGAEGEAGWADAEIPVAEVRSWTARRGIGWSRERIRRYIRVRGCLKAAWIMLKMLASGLRKEHVGRSRGPKNCLTDLSIPRERRAPVWSRDLKRLDTGS